MAFTPYNYDESKGFKGGSVDSKDVQKTIETIFPSKLPILNRDEILRVLRKTDVYTVAGVLKWCWSRLQGGVVTWATYNKYKEAEKANHYKPDSFAKLIGTIIESEAHFSIIDNFYLLLSSLSTNADRNRMEATKLARISGLWAFEMVNSKAEKPTNFKAGLNCFTLSSEASFHLFLAYIRAMYPKPTTVTDYEIPQSISKLIDTIPYPPKAKLFKRFSCPKITLSVGKLSSNPFLLLQRVSKIIQFDNYEMFPSEDDFNTLYFMFDDINRIEEQMSVSTRRLLEAVTKEHSIFTDHSLFIKQTPDLPYDIRCKTWSKHFNHAFIDPVSGDPHRPLTNYVYEKYQKELIKKTAMPTTERSKLPYPDSPVLSGKEKPIQIGSWREIMHYYNKALGDPQPDVEIKGERDITRDDKTTCTLSKVSIDDFFPWVWANTVSPEQTEINQAMFGRSVVLEIHLDNKRNGRRWIVVEEVLTPEPLPMRKKVKVPEPKPVKPVIKVTKPSKRLDDKHNFKYSEPSTFVKPKPTRAKTSEPKPKSSKFSFDNIDPLVAAVAAKLKVETKTTYTQTDTLEDELGENDLPKDILADDNNTKGIQVYVDAEEPPEILISRSQKFEKEENFVPCDLPNISISPPLDPIEFIQNHESSRQKSPTPSLKEDISAIPYMNNADFESSITVQPILSDEIPQILDDFLPEPVTDLISENPVPNHTVDDFESFISTIDSTGVSLPKRRVVSTPVTTSNENYTPFISYGLRNKGYSDDVVNSNIDLTQSNYRVLAEDDSPNPPKLSSFVPSKVAPPQDIPPPMFNAPSQPRREFVTNRPPIHNDRFQPPPFPTNIASAEHESQYRTHTNNPLNASQAISSNERLPDPAFPRPHFARTSTSGSGSGSGSSSGSPGQPRPPRQRHSLPPQRSQDLMFNESGPSNYVPQQGFGSQGNTNHRHSMGPGAQDAKMRSGHNIPSVDSMMMDSGPMRMTRINLSHVPRNPPPITQPNNTAYDSFGLLPEPGNYHFAKQPASGSPGSNLAFSGEFNRAAQDVGSSDSSRERIRRARVNNPDLSGGSGSESEGSKKCVPPQAIHAPRPRSGVQPGFLSESPLRSVINNEQQGNYGLGPETSGESGTGTNAESQSSFGPPQLQSGFVPLSQTQQSPQQHPINVSKNPYTITPPKPQNQPLQTAFVPQSDHSSSKSSLPSSSFPNQNKFDPLNESIVNRSADLLTKNNSTEDGLASTSVGLENKVEQNSTEGRKEVVEFELDLGQEKRLSKATLGGLISATKKAASKRFGKKKE